jgi:hypothetical protein
MLLSGLWESTRGRIRSVLVTSIIVGVAIVFLDRVSSGRGVYDSGRHWKEGGMMDGEKVEKGRGGDAVVMMALKKGCGREPKVSQGCATTLKRGRTGNNDNGQSSKKDKERANLDRSEPHRRRVW